MLKSEQKEGILLLGSTEIRFRSVLHRVNSKGGCSGLHVLAIVLDVPKPFGAKLFCKTAHLRAPEEDGKEKRNDNAIINYIYDIKMPNIQSASLTSRN